MTPAVVSLVGYRTGPARLRMLVRRMATEDTAAFAAFHAALTPAVNAAVRTRVPAPAGVDAITAATFLQAWLYAPAHTAPDTDVQAWVTAIAVGLADDRATVDEPGPEAGADDAADILTVAGLLKRGPVRRRRGRSPGVGR